VKVSFVVNGVSRDVETAPDRRVIDLLREDMGLTGAKEACGRGDCGACIILVDGVTRHACLMLAAQLQGREIVTIEAEGLELLTRLQDAFVQHGAIQCGFCTPGMIMSAFALLRENPTPERERIRETLAGNFCRCGTHPKVIAALEALIMSMKESAR
jgi:carbon-monoxide dehydrogenase small subunit